MALQRRQKLTRFEIPQSNYVAVMARQSPSPCRVYGGTGNIVDIMRPARDGF
jgi:hypothetical protein